MRNLITFALVLLAGTASADIMKTTSKLTNLWESAAAKQDCGDDPLDASEVCREAVVARLTRTTVVRTTVPSGDRCGTLIEVLVASGRHAGKTGCVAAIDVAISGLPPAPAAK